MRTIVTFLVVVAAVGVAPGQVQSAQSGVSCHRINANGVGQDLGGGQTVARISGGGLLNGTTVGSFAIVDATTLPRLGVAGSVTFTTNHATLTVGVTGFFDLSTGVFETSGDVVSATGKLAGATGRLTLRGVQDLTTGAFTETVSGEICVNLAP